MGAGQLGRWQERSLLLCCPLQDEGGMRVEVQSSTTYIECLAARSLARTTDFAGRATSWQTGSSLVPDRTTSYCWNSKVAGWE
jgi:hypothetical protein